MPQIWGVRLVGALPDWVSAKDVILEMLRRHGVRGGRGRILEYHGPGLAELSVWDRHVIANMGTELGATTSVFPADDVVRAFLRSEHREPDFVEITAARGASYDVEEEIDLGKLEPLIAKPSSPGNVVAVREVAGADIYQAYIGSSANPGFRDFAVTASIVDDKTVFPGVSLDINPTSRSMLEDLVREGYVGRLLHAGARIHQAGCNGCIGMGQAPATGRNSLRTVPRNFPGRSGTKEDSVWLCSPETAAASALFGKITDPRTLDMPYPRPTSPDTPTINDQMFAWPDGAQRTSLVKGPNIQSLPDMDPLPDDLSLPILLLLGDDISTDEIMPAGARVLPLRSNIPKLSEHCFELVDETYPARALEHQQSGHVIVAGENYGQGSSREHAALAPRYLGLRAVLAKSFARIHWQNLVSFGVLPLEFERASDYDTLHPEDVLRFEGLRRALSAGDRLGVLAGERRIGVRHALTRRQVELVLAGSLVHWIQNRLTQRADARHA
jgi:aconitate hydratase